MQRMSRRPADRSLVAEGVSPSEPPEPGRTSLLETVWLLALVTVPSAVNPFAASRFDTEKGLVLRGWGLMAAVLLFARWVRVLRMRRRSPDAAGNPEAPLPQGGREVRSLLAVLGGWVLVQGLAAVLALSPGLAWHGGSSRGGGVWTLLACVSLLLSIVSECRRPVQRERILLAMALGSVGPTLVGWLQIAGVRLFIGAQGLPESRPWGTFGNAIALGGYLVAVLPAVGYWVWRLRKWVRVLPFLLLLAQGLLLLRTASRGPLIGLLVGVGLLLLLLARQRGYRNVVIAGGIACITLAAVCLGGIHLVARSEIVRQHTRTGMLTRFNTVEVRVLLYQAMTRRMASREPLELPGGVADRLAAWRLWIGYGPECLAEPLLSRLPARFETVEEEGRIPDSTHSFWMDVLGSTGLLGLVLYLLLSLRLFQVVWSVLGFRLGHRDRWRSGLSLLACTLLGTGVVVWLWGDFAWALGLLFGASLGVLVALVVAVSAERAGRSLPGDPPASGTSASDPLVGLAATAVFTALWVEAHFGIPLVVNTLLSYVMIGLLLSLARPASGVPEPPAGGEDSPFGGWVPVSVLCSGLLLVTSSMTNTQALTDWFHVLRDGLLRQYNWVLVLWTLALAVAGGGARGRRRVFWPALALSVFFLVGYASGLAALRTAPLRSIAEIVEWSARMQASAAWRLLPWVFVPALLAIPRWREVFGGAVAGSVALLVVSVWFWPPIQNDILLSTAQYTADLGEPEASMKVIAAALPPLEAAPQPAHLASQVRMLASRAARAAPELQSEAAWDRAIFWAEQAVNHRPWLAVHHGELAGVLETASRESYNPSRSRVLARKADAAYSVAVALAPGLNVHRRRQAGLRFTVQRDPEGSFRILEEMLAADPEEPVALSMMSRNFFLAGNSSTNQTEQIRLFTTSLEYGERAIRSRTSTARRMDFSGTREDLATVRSWFEDRSIPLPGRPESRLETVPFLPPRLPAAADRGTLMRMARSGLAAWFMALVLTPFFRRIARTTGYVDVPAVRKLHQESTPLLGGCAILLAVWTGFLLGSPGGLPAPYLSVLGVATGLALVGLLDDRQPWPWWGKLLAQVLAAMALWVAGVRVRLAWLPPWANVGLTMGWLVGITNAVNFLDNMNGLSAGLSLLAAVGVAVLGILNEGWNVALLAVVMAGACLGFLRYNHHWRATIFMGDGGSLFLGSLLASLSLHLRFPANHNWVTWLCPVLLLAVPVFDMTHVCLARLRRGRNPFSTPGKDHTSHLLARMGLGTHGAVWSIHAAVLLCVLAAGGVAYTSAVVAYGIAGLVFAVAVFLLLYFELRFGRGGTQAEES